MAASTGPVEPVPVAVLARTSTLVLQDPAASLRRQITSTREWLPPGFYVAGYYWDVEVGHRWHRSSDAAFSRLCSLFLVGFLFLFGRCPAGTGVEAGRAGPALA